MTAERTPARLVSYGSEYAWPKSGPSLLEELQIGKIDVPSARLSMSDIGEPFESESELQSIDIGANEAMMSLGLIRWTSKNSRRYGRASEAAVDVRISEHVTVEWEFAFAPKNPYLQIDYGVGCLFDSAAHRELLDLQAARDEMGSLFDRVKATHFVSRGSITAFGCGVGGGAYPVWLGRDDAGRPSRVVIDLQVLDMLDPS